MAVIGGDPVEVPAVRGRPALGWGPGLGGIGANGTRTPDAYTLGWDPAGAQAAGAAAGRQGQNAWHLTQDAHRGGRELENAAATAQGIALQPAYGLQQGQGVAQQLAGAIDQRVTPTANFAPATAAIQDQRGVAAQLAQAAGRTTGSGAQAQLQQGMNEAINSQMSIAKSGSGFGANAAGLNQAASNASALIGQQANQSALLQAQTDQADAARQLSALGAAGDQYGAAAGAEAQIASRQAELALSGMSANDARAQALNELAFQYGSGAMQGIQAGAQLGLQGQQSARDFAAGAALDAQRLGLEANQQVLGSENLQLQGANLAMGGRQAYEDDLNEIYAIEKGVELGNRQLENGADMQNAEMALGALAAVGMLAASDRRMKHKIEKDSLSRRYAALAGAMP